jgi:hypothetical protein
VANAIGDVAPYGGYPDAHFELGFPPPVSPAEAAAHRRAIAEKIDAVKTVLRQRGFRVEPADHVLLQLVGDDFDAKPEAELAALRLFEAMYARGDDSRVVCFLGALFQSGKTAVMHHLARLAAANEDRTGVHGVGRHHKFSNAVVATGMNSTAWVEQTRGRFFEDFAPSIFHLPDKLEAQAVWARQTQRPRADGSTPMLVMLDESRIASRKKQFLQEVRARGGGG